ncbi:thiolase C-terminal domain-containing protein [Actinomadura madurae]|uniref:thiolase C-terminal domain-containing protein n=1 Tax=Actinomadura madurae TaxID=1993 RepID=UPI0020D22608|nr:hypothetical protein [Actinomadura madurae]MCQ0003827.1 hypothetical protein [Actinomadura madurae]
MPRRPRAPARDGPAVGHPERAERGQADAPLARRHRRARLYAEAGVTAGDINAAYLQDGTSVWVLQMLEWYGFCGLGEAGPFLAEGHTRPGGSLPVNTHGGQLSESYTHNWMHLYEAVRQLRGECGDRQLDGPELALHAQTHDFWKGAATLLSTRETA